MTCQLLAALDPADLSDPMDVITYLQRVEKVEAFLAALKVKALVALAGAQASPASMDEAHVVTEVALARRVGQGSAHTSIDVARALTVHFPEFLTALQAGQISEWHCRELVTATRSVTDPDVRRQVADATLAKATRMTPYEFGREVAKAIARYDRDLTTRIETAREDRRVWCTPLPDGMGFLGLIHDWTTVQAIHATITADGRTLQLDRGGSAAVRAGDDDARADASRADAMAARMLGTVAEDGSVTWDRSTQQVVSMTLVMDLDTLQGEVDRFALLDGAPIPAGIARDLAEGAKLWRRAVTDPVSGCAAGLRHRAVPARGVASLRQGPRRRVRHPDLLTHEPPGDGPRRALPGRHHQRGQLPRVVHDLSPAQDRTTTPLHRHEARRLGDLDHRLGAALLDPAADPSCTTRTTAAVIQRRRPRTHDRRDHHLPLAGSPIATTTRRPSDPITNLRAASVLTRIARIGSPLHDAALDGGRFARSSPRVGPHRARRPGTGERRTPAGAGDGPGRAPVSLGRWGRSRLRSGSRGRWGRGRGRSLGVRR